MKSLLRKNLLLLMLGVTAAAYALSVESPAFAKNGSDDSSNSSGSDSSGSSGGDDDSGSGNHHDGNDDNSSNSGNSDDDDDRNDDSNDRSASNDDGMKAGSGASNGTRPRIQITVDAATRAGLLNGTLVAVDNLGRPLEVEADIRNGQSVLTAKPHGGDAKRNPGPIASYQVVPASQAPVHQ
jgi:hypothetical protein